MQEQFQSSLVSDESEEDYTKELLKTNLYVKFDNVEFYGEVSGDNEVFINSGSDGRQEGDDENAYNTLHPPIVEHYNYQNYMDDEGFRDYDENPAKPQNDPKWICYEHTEPHLMDNNEDII